MFAAVIGNALPEQAEHEDVPVVPVDAGPAQLDGLAAERLERGEVELLSGIIA